MHRLARAALIAALAGLCFGIGYGLGEYTAPEPSNAVIEEHDGRSFVVFDHDDQHYVIELEVSE